MNMTNSCNKETQPNHQTNCQSEAQSITSSIHPLLCFFYLLHLPIKKFKPKISKSKNVQSYR